MQFAPLLKISQPPFYPRAFKSWHYLKGMSCNTIATVSQAQAKARRKNSSLLSWDPCSPRAGHQQRCRAVAGLFHSSAAFSFSPPPLLPPFQSNIANVIFHESCSIYQGQWHTEAADECLTPLDLYNERWESETHSGVVSTCTKEVEMIYSASEGQCFGEL